ncbi:MAG: diguanylate cyclase [Mariprofundaceae bacterium]
MLLVTLSISQYLLLNKQETSILKEEAERAEFMANGLLSSLQTLMLSGDATYAHDWLERLSDNPEILKLQIIRTDGNEAFRDLSTVQKVSQYLETDQFNRAALPAETISDLSTDDFKAAGNGKSSFILDEEKSNLTFLLPIKRGEECVVCHGYDLNPVGGVLRITTDISKAQARIHESRKSSITYGLIVMIVIGLLLYLFIRRQILSPLETLNAATSRITAGDFENRINVQQKNELGMLEESFNQMMENLLNTTISKDYVESIMNSLGEMLFVTDSDKKIISANPAAVRTLGYSKDELIGMHIDRVSENTNILALNNGDSIEDEEARSIECNFRKKSGELFPVLVTLTQLDNKEKLDCGIVFACRDITHQKHAEHELLLASKVMENDSNAILICDATGTILLVNPAFSDITGYSREEAIGNTPKILSSGRQSKEFYKEMWHDILVNNCWKGEIWNRRKNGEIYPESLSITTLRDEAGEVTNFVSIFTDITTQKDIEKKLVHMAHHDGLTGLPNRVLFIDRLEHALEHNRRGKQQVALMFIDIDGFKMINDTHGHDIGDGLLVSIAKGISSKVREADTVARVGGDEFVIILEQIHELKNVTHIADKIINLFRQPFIIEGVACDVGVSIGIAVHPDDSDDVDDLVKKADTAMYHAKTSGKMKYSIFSVACVDKKE